MSQELKQTDSTKSTRLMLFTFNSPMAEYMYPYDYCEGGSGSDKQQERAGSVFSLCIFLLDTIVVLTCAYV